jgi:hypothetical protein
MKSPLKLVRKRQLRAGQWSINGVGQIAGTCYFKGVGVGGRPFRWTDSEGMQDATGALSPDRTTLALDGLAWVAPTQIATTARQWRDHLCAFADRPFHADELDALPPGADAGSPCVS